MSTGSEPPASHQLVVGGAVPVPERGPDGPEVVRRAGLDDADAIAAFQTWCWREAYSGLVPQPYLDRVDAAARAVRWRRRLLRATRDVAVAEADHQVVGVVSWATTDVDDAPRLELKSLYVSPARRGTGTAARLLQVALGDQPAHLWVFEGNRRARAFYGKHRFAPDGRRALDDDTGVGMLRMTRPPHPTGPRPGAG